MGAVNIEDLHKAASKQRSTVSSVVKASSNVNRYVAFLAVKQTPNMTTNSILDVKNSASIAHLSPTQKCNGFRAEAAIPIDKQNLINIHTNAPFRFIVAHLFVISKQIFLLLTSSNFGIIQKSIQEVSSC
jgi:hypothetical protein